MAEPSAIRAALRVEKPSPNSHNEAGLHRVHGIPTIAFYQGWH